MAAAGSALPLPGSVPGTRRRLAGFVRLLRDNGFPVGLPEVEDAERVARAVDLSRAHELRWALRALLTASVIDWRRFDELFDAYWLRQGMKRVIKISGETNRFGARRRPGAPVRPTGSNG